MNAERAPATGEELFTLTSGDHVWFDPTKSLRPDLVSEALGYEAGMIVHVMHFMHAQHGTLDRPLRVLELGSGTGVSLVACLSMTRPGVNTELLAIDRDSYCISQSAKNLDVAARKHSSDTLFTAQLADWFDPGMWAEVGKQSWDVVLFNPPYKAPGEPVRPEFSQTPPEMLYTNDEAGLENYEQVLPRIIPLLSDLEGATLLARIPAYFGKPGYFEIESLRERRIDELIRNATQTAGGNFTVLRGTRGLYPSGRGGDEPHHAHAAVTRGKTLAPHYDPMILEAALNNYPDVPRTVEQFMAMRKGKRPDMRLF